MINLFKKIWFNIFPKKIIVTEISRYQDIEEEQKTLIDVQINGFCWAQLEVDNNTISDEVEKLAKPLIEKALWKTQIIETIYSPGQYINFVTKLPARKSAEKSLLKCQVCDKEFMEYLSCFPGIGKQNIRIKTLCNFCVSRQDGCCSKPIDVTNKLPGEMQYISQGD